MIVLGPGFKPVSKEWPHLINKSKKEVEEIMKKEMPNVECKVFDEEEFKYCSEEFYYTRIALVVNKNGIVVSSPKFFGSEPDLDKIVNPAGKGYKSICEDINHNIPDVKVVVKGKDGGEIWSNKEEADHYILVKVDNQDKVCGALEYVRIAK